MAGCDKCTNLIWESCDCTEYGTCKHGGYGYCDLMPQYSGLKSFPFTKKEMPCFQLDFWHSEFADYVDDSDDSYKVAYAKYKEKYVLKPAANNSGTAAPGMNN